jgi:Rrf2 family protein
MHISAKGTYGIKAVLDLALHEGQGYVQRADIAARQNIPEPYLVQLLNLLKKAGIVRSVRGPKGGHAMAKRPREVSVGEVLVALEGPIDLAGRREGERAGQEGDVLREVWNEVEDAIEKVVSSITFEDLCRRDRVRRESLVFRI